MFDRTEIFCLKTLEIDNAFYTNNSLRLLHATFINTKRGKSNGKDTLSTKKLKQSVCDLNSRQLQNQFSIITKIKAATQNKNTHIAKNKKYIA